ncbi:MAG: sigma-70 family RNA polymerase sigma factor [Planctomycetota bacterium]
MNDTVSDVNIMLMVKDGDENAFEELYEKYSSKILGFFYKLSFNKAVAEECMQEVFFKLWKGRKKYEASGKFTTYLFQIAKNYWFTYSKHLSYKKRSSATDFNEIAADKVSANNPEAAAVQNELVERMQNAVKSLADDLRIPFILSRYEGFKYEEIGEILSLSPRTIEGKIREAAKILVKLVL